MISLNLGNPERSEKREITLEEFPQLRQMLGPPVAAGVPVNQASAKSISAYMCGLNVISGDIGVLDRSLVQLVGEDDDPETAHSHPAHKVIHDAPNPWMIPQIFWQTITAHALSWGNGYAEIEYDNAGRPIALWPITPDRVEVKVETKIVNGRKVGKLWYLVDGNDVVPYDEMFHLPGLGFDGLTGYSVVSIARQSLGLSIAAERFGAAFFGNGGWPGVVLQHPEEMSDEAQKRFYANMADFHQGADRAHKWLILEEGMKVSKPITIPPNDAQFLETRQFQVEEIARWLNLPLIKLHYKEAERAGGSPEAMQIQYQTTTLMPWVKRISQEIMRKLVVPSARSSYKVVHDFTQLLVADTATRVAAEEAWVNMGATDAAHVARMEHLPKPKAKPAAPAAEAIPAAPAVEPRPAAPETAPARGVDREFRDRLIEAHRATALDRLTPYVHREAERVRQALKKGPADVVAWAEDFYRREAVVLTGLLTPLVRMSLVVGGSTDDPEALAGGEARAYLESSKDDLLSLRAKDLAFEAEKMTQRWEKTRALSLTDRVIGIVDRTKGANDAA